MDDIQVLDFRGFYILISKINGSTITIDSEVYQNKDLINQLLIENNMYDEIEINGKYNKELFKTIYISLHTSSKCNMACTYCFKKDRDDTNLTFDESKRFIDMIIDEYPTAGKYIVDPTGSGEPLLNKYLLLQIGEYCKDKSNELKREALPMIVTNGTLLDKTTVQELRDAGILFGVSLDGDKASNDFYRKDFSGNSVYKKVIKNIKNIKDRSLMGVAVTLTDKNTDLVKTLKHLIKYFPTVSIKPVRSLDGNIGINKGNVDEIKKEYTKLFDFLIHETQKGNLEYIAALLNGDDYFGKFMLRLILNHKVLTRCDAGIGRFSLAQDGNIYACPGAIGIEELEVGSLEGGISYKIRDKLYKVLTEREKCNDCFARFVCGGECMVSSYYSTNKIDEVDQVMCELKKHLYKLSLLFNHIIGKTSYYKTIYLACIEKTKRFDEDSRITKYLEDNPQISFMDVKLNRENT
jgi:radical SAM protein with 4Fe4S-binding SPASM domain